jgi:hypothetical protein
MFFSGQLLDDYSKCVEALDANPIHTIVATDGEEGEETALLPDRAKVKIAGVITEVTVKTTKRDERMAFFTVEDSGGTIECLAFPKTYQAAGNLIRNDCAVFVEGNLSVREDESPKVLVSLMGELVDNAHFSAEEKPVERAPAPAEKPKPEIGAQVPVSQSETGSRPQAVGGGYNPYDAMPPSRAYNPYEAMPAVAPPPRAAAGPAPRPTPPQPSAAPPQKLYLRVPDMEGASYRQALNLCEIFCDGMTAVIFYDMKEKKYLASTLRVRATPFVLERLKRVLGEENVVGK